MNERDLDLLSSYLDNELTREEQDQLEARLAVDAALRRELETLRETKALLLGLPPLRAPRDLTLTPQQVAQPRTPLLLSPWLSLASAAAAVLLVLGGLLSSNLGAPEARSVPVRALQETLLTVTPAQTLAAATMTPAPLTTNAPPSLDAARNTAAASAPAAAGQSAADSFAQEASPVLPLSDVTQTSMPQADALMALSPTPAPLSGVLAQPQIAPSPLPTQTAVPTQVPVPPNPAPAGGSADASLLIAAGIVLAIVALVTTWLRSRR